VIAQLSANTWTQIIVAFSVFIPVTVALAITIVVLRGKKNDPDEQRWKRLAEQRRESERD
jgi:heme/copper-type cytochrome/quinol oxidase subunit 2